MSATRLLASRSALTFQRACFPRSPCRFSGVRPQPVWTPEPAGVGGSFDHVQRLRV